MTTREEILEEIRKLNGVIEGLESDLLSPTIDANERTAMRNQITAIRNEIAIEKQRLHSLEQQGKFLHVFPLPVPNLLDVILCPISFDISSSLIQFRRKVRGDGSS